MKIVFDDEAPATIVFDDEPVSRIVFDEPKKGIDTGISSKAVASGLGAPVDLVAAGLRAVGVPVGDKPIGGSESIKNAFRKVGIPVTDREAEGLGENILQGISEVAAFTGPASAVTRAATQIPGLTGRIARTIDDFLIQRPVASTASDIGAGAGMGAATEIAKDIENEALKTGIQVAGGLAGGVAGVALTPQRQMVDAMRREFGVQFTPSKNVGQDVVEIIHQAAGKVEGAKFAGATIRARLNRAIESAPDPTKSSDELRDYVLGLRKSIPRDLLSVKDEVIAGRKEITRFQKELLANHYSGKRVLPDNLVEQFENAGAQAGWVKRSYQFWGDPNYKPTDQQRASAINELTTMRREALPGMKLTGEESAFLTKKLVDEGMSPEQAGKFVSASQPDRPPMSRADAEKLLAKWDIERSGDNALESAYRSGRDAGILTPRKELGPAVRDYLGEIRSPGEILESSIMSIAKLASYDTADMQIASTLKNMGLVRTAEQGLEGYVPLTLRRGPAQIDGQELYVPSDIQRSLNNLYGSGGMNNIENATVQTLANLFSAGISTKKAMLVPFNMVTYSTNAITNSAQVLAQGMVPFKSPVKGFTTAAAAFEGVATRLKQGGRAYVKRMSELGLANPGFTTSDILAGLSQNPSRIARGLTKIIEPAGKAYSLTDTALRVSVYESTKAQMLREMPDVARLAAQNTPQGRATLDLLERTAAQQTNATYQQYSHINQNIRALSKYGILGQFVSFNAEMLRNQYNQGRLILDKLNGNYAARMKQRFGVDVDQSAATRDALTRLASISAVYAAGIGGVAAYNYGPGGVKDEREAKALQETVAPDYLKNKTLVMQRGPDGKLSYKNAEYVIPHLATVSPVLSALRGESFGDAVANFGNTVLTDYGGELPLFLIDLVNAIHDPDITQEPGTMGRIIDRSAWFADAALKPQGVKELEKTFGPNPRQTVGTLVKRLTGQRVAETTIEEGARRNMRGTATNMRQLKGQATRAMEEGRMDVLPDLQGQYDRNFAVLANHVNNLRIIGQNEDQIISILKGVVPSREILDLLDGNPGQLKPQRRTTAADVWEQWEADGLTVDSANAQREIAQRIREYPDRNVRENLRRRLDREKTDLRRGVTGRDKIYRSLGVEDGTRAEYIYQRSLRSPDARGYIRELQRKGIVSPQVMNDIRKLEQAASQGQPY